MQGPGQAGVTETFFILPYRKRSRNHGCDRSHPKDQKSIQKSLENL